MVISFRNFLRRWITSLSNRRLPQSRDSFASFQEALDFASLPAYASVELAEVVVSKTLRWKDETSRTNHLDAYSSQTLLGLVAASPGSQLRVLDFGGGAGIHYLQTLAFLGPGVDVRWNVVETPQMVEAALPRCGNDQLKFFTSIDSAARDLGRADLVLSNSALPYSPNPLADLEKLVGLRASHVYITRTPLGEGEESFTFLQSSKLSHNGPGPLPAEFADYEVQYPITIVSKNSFEARLKSHYSVRFWIREASNPFLGGVGKTQNYSYFCDLTPPTPGETLSS